MSTKESSESTKSKGRRQRKNKKSPHEDEKNSRGQAADTKVVVFSEKQFFALKQQESHAGPAGAAGGMLPPHLSTDFPSLSPGPEQPGSPQPLITSCWGRSNTLLDPFPRLGCSPCNPPDTVQDSSPLVPIVVKESLASRLEAPKEAASSQKVRKSKRPILLDVSFFIKKNGKGKLGHPSSVPMKRSTGPVLGGNILDSSMPARHKGKFRERKKIKLSRLKTNIIKDRILKTLTQTNTESTAVDKIDLKYEIKKYLDHLSKEKEMLKSCKKNLESHTEKSSHATKPVPVAQNSVQTFSCKFRSYCENMVTVELNDAVRELVKGLVQLQDRAFSRDPVRARARKRFVTGLRESAKYLKLKRVRLLIVAPDLEASAPEGHLTSCIRELKEEARISNVACVFALDRRKLGYCSLRKAPVSAFAVISYEGLEGLFQNVMNAWETARLSFIDNFRANEEPELPEPPVVVAELLEKLKVGNSSDGSGGNDDLDGSTQTNPFLKALLSNP